MTTTSTSPIAIGIIGGTGLYDLPGFENAQWVTIESAFGEPSDQLLIGDFMGHRLVFLPRHGRGHRIPPTEINYRANIEAMKRTGVNRIVSFSAVGSLREDLTPGTFVLVDQYIDRTFARESSFSGPVSSLTSAWPIPYALQPREASQLPPPQPESKPSAAALTL